MIEYKINEDEIIVGRIVKIQDLEKQKGELESRQLSSQSERDAYDMLDDFIKSQVRVPINFQPEIDEISNQIERYKSAGIGREV